MGKKGKPDSFLPLPALSLFGSRSISRAAKTANSVVGLSLNRNQTETLATQGNLTLFLKVRVRNLEVTYSFDKMN